MTSQFLKWTSEELNKVGNAEELQIATLRRDGTLRKPVIIWVVRVGDDLFVRCANGRRMGSTAAPGHHAESQWTRQQSTGFVTSGARPATANWH